MSAELDAALTQLGINPKDLAAAAGSSGSFSWTPPNAAMAPTGGVTEATLSRLGFAGVKAAGTFTDDSAVKQYADMSPEQRRTVQQQLYDVGLYDSPYYTGKQSVRWGQYDLDTKQALDRATAMAKGSGNLDMVLSQKADLSDLAAKARERQPLTVHLTNPEDIKALGNQVAVQVVGRKLTTEELNKLVATRQSQERSAQQTAYAQAGASGGTVTDPATSQGAFESEIRSMAPVEAGAHDIATQFSNFLSILKGMS